MAQKTQDRIREEAYRLWENDGRPEGKEMDYWLAAEKKIGGSANKSAVAVVKSKTTKSTPKKK